MNQWAKTAYAKDVEQANLISKEKQTEEKAATAIWYDHRESILLPYLNGDKFLVRMLLDITKAMKEWMGSLGWTFKDGKFYGITKGAKVVCTKSNIGHVGYVLDLMESDIKFRITTLNTTYVGNWLTIESDWGLTILPDDVDISKQMTASEALKWLQTDKKTEVHKGAIEHVAALPEVTDLSWGVIKVKHSGDNLRFKDAKLYPGGATAWDWGLTGTHHNPGIQYADIQEILDSGVDQIILSRGQYGNLGVTNGLTEQIEGEDVIVHVAKTTEAVNMYENLRKQGVNVGIIIHSTC